MQPAMQHRRGQSLSSVAREKDEDLALFYEMQKREREKKNVIRPSAATDCSNQIPHSSVNGTVDDDLLTADSEKNDYDWLLTPPATPLLSSLDHDALAPPHNGTTPVVRSLTPLKTSRLGSAMGPSSNLVCGNLGSKQLNSSSTFSNSSNLGLRQASTSSSASNNAPSRRSSSASTPGTKATSRPSTPTGRANIPSITTRPGSLSRPATPTRRPATPTLRQSQSSAPTVTRSSSVSKASSLPSKGVTSSRGSSPTPRTRPWHPSAMPDFHLETPPNLRTTVPERSPSNQRGSSVTSRPGGTAASRTSQSELVDASHRTRRQSCSPTVTRGRLSPGSQSRDVINIHTGRTTNCAVEVTVPVVLGSKILEKVTKPKSIALSPEDQTSPVPGSQMKQMPKPASPTMRDTSGFGRNLSKKSLDMALRHMDIRRSMPNGFRPLISNIPASSLYSIRAGSCKTGPARSAADSPVATSSNASSEHSISIVQEQEGSEQGDEAGSQKCNKLSLVSQPESPSEDVSISNWVGSPDYKDDSVELMQLFRQDIERLSGLESPLVSQNGEASEYSHHNKLGPDQHSMKSS